MVALVIIGCGASGPHDRLTTQASVPQAHPQVVEPLAGAAAPGSTTPQPAQPTAVAPPPPTPGPSAPASVTTTPAKGAPTDAQVRAAIAQFQLAIAQYHLNALDLSGVLIDPSQLPPGVWNVSIASVETAYGHGVACGGILRVSELGVANKTLPCGTEVIFRYAGRIIRVPVIDRGPYIPGREWDLSGAAAVALHFPGLGPVEWRLR
jgi:rare lipoprotein A (peptidoglycan hydrolase)